MRKQPRVLSINFPFQDQQVVQEESLATLRALFDFDVLVIRPERFNFPTGDYGLCQGLKAMMHVKESELARLFANGGIAVVLLDVPCTYSVLTGGYSIQTRYSVSNYDFLSDDFADCLRSGSGEQISYYGSEEPFVEVLKRSIVAWTAYVVRDPPPPFHELRFFAKAGAGARVAGKMPYQEGHLIILPNLMRLEETLFFEVCNEYRYERQGSTAPDWLKDVYLPGLSDIQSRIENIDKQILDLRAAWEQETQQEDDRLMYRKLLYEKGRTQLEPIIVRALNDLGFAATPGEIIKGTNYEIDGRTTKGSMPGLVEVKGSKKQILLEEFSPFVVKIVADHQATGVISKGILVGNGLCETSPENRLGDAIFSPHVLDGSRRNSIALVNSAELYWLCCTLLDGATLDRNAIREAILTGNGYVDLKLFCGKSPWRKTT